MPIHNWKKATPGLFHHFHQNWTVELCAVLNEGVLPSGFFALVEQKAVGVEPDVLTFGATAKPSKQPDLGGGLAVAEAQPKVRYRSKFSEVEAYARRANRIGVRTAHGDLVAAIELVSPGNKSGKHAITSFVEKAVDFLYRGVNLLMIDLFPPTPRDPSGIHKLIWDEIVEEPFDLPSEKPLTVAAYEGAPDFAAYVDSVGVGDTLPEAPLFFHPGRYVPVPLEATYQRTWDRVPQAVKDMAVWD
ncbi:MAG: DUF4058 family protein [Gemmataceae bacterium]